ncbi:tRNA synthetases class I family protein, partial [Orientia tsutsugamushi str. Gilliam]
KEVIFLTGTDEHGQKVEKAASNAGVSPKEFVDKIASSFQNLALTLIYQMMTLLEQLIQNILKQYKVVNVLEQQGDIYLVNLWMVRNQGRSFLFRIRAYY